MNYMKRIGISFAFGNNVVIGVGAGVKEDITTLGAYVDIPARKIS